MSQDETPDSGMSEQHEPMGHEGKRIGKFIPLLLVAGLILLYLVMWNKRKDFTDYGRRHAAVGESLQKLDLQPLTGADKRLTLEDVNGQVTLINYWGTWCPPCREEMPHLLRINRSFRHNDDFRFVSVSCLPSLGTATESQLRDDTTAYLRTLKADIVTYSDMQGVSRKALADSAKLRQFGVPTTLVIDRDGAIKGLWLGYTEGAEDEIVALLRSLLP